MSKETVLCCLQTRGSEGYRGPNIYISYWLTTAPLYNVTSNIEVEGLSGLPHILEVVGPDLGSALTLYQLTIYL